MPWIAAKSMIGIKPGHRFLAYENDRLTHFTDAMKLFFIITSAGILWPTFPQSAWWPSFG